MKNFLILSLLSLFGSVTYAVDVTNGPLQHHPALCNYGYNLDCGHNNGATTPPKKIIRHITVNVPSKYGALAANEKTGSVGGASNADSLSEAKKAAIRQCGEKGCKVITWARNGCIAAAGGKLGKHWKLSKAVEKPGESEAVAMKRCKSTGASNCQIIISESCSVPDGMYN
ncbi:DUF4189 domain-containing protein [Neisseria sp. CCUG12390]|uniref:DUF4189 domain-containing protein n=1 Tax=Neisseria sp. CCUG12390 TaxID=3392035 RepID=UPI003A100743